nr:hypothetical protein GCM10020063_063030 [Dactylosporangium thailandense]
MIDDDDAAAAASAFLDEAYRRYPEPGRHARDTVRTAPELGFKDGRFFVVPYNSVDLLDHGDTEAELGGNAPIMVDRETGECHFMTLDEELEYHRRGFTI